MSEIGKYAWWFIGDIHAPAWVSLMLAILWAGLTYAAHKRGGWNRDTLCFFAVACVRFGMWVAGIPKL